MGVGGVVITENALFINSYRNNLAGIHLSDVPRGNLMSGQQNKTEFVACIWREIWWRLSVRQQFSCLKYIFSYWCHEILKVTVFLFRNSSRKGELQIWGQQAEPAWQRAFTSNETSNGFASQWISKKQNEISNRPLSSNMRPPLVTSLLSRLNNGALSRSQTKNKYERASVNQAKWKGLNLPRVVPGNYQSFQQASSKG